MVLKKSNSRLNSGATQRAVTHEGISKIYDFCFLSLENYFVLTTDINMSNPEALNSLRETLEEMYAYLGFDITDLSHTITRSLRPHKRDSGSTNSAKYIKEGSLDKNNLWLLPERITQMKSDIDFLRSLTRNLDVRFHEVQDNRISVSANSTSKSLRSKVIASSEIIAKSLDCVKQPTSPSKRRQTSHCRGVQRSHFLRRKHKNCHEMQHSEAEGKEETLGHLDLYLYGPYRMEARSAYYRAKKKYAGCPNASRLKSSTKMNGRSKGRFPCRLGYYNRDLEIDTRDGIKEVYEGCTNLTGFKDSEELTSHHMPKSQEMNYDVTDFITVRKRRVKGGKKDKRKRATQDEEDVGDCAPLVDRIRYPKGSFVLVSKDEYDWEPVNPQQITTSLPRRDNSNFSQNESWLAMTTTAEVGLEILPTEKANTTKAFELGDINDLNSLDIGFVMVSLALSEEQKKWFSCTQERRDTERLVDNNYPVKFGNSFPECFVVDCNPNQMHASGQHWRVLIGRRTEPWSDLWLVSIQDQWQTPTQTKQHLQNLTATYKKASFSIPELIEVATALDSREVTTQPRRVSQPAREEWLSSNVVWRNMPLNIFTATESCTVDETANVLKEEFIIDRKLPQIQVKSFESLGDSNLTQCGVCLMDYDHSVMCISPIVLLPCSHKYCVCCWRAHLKHCIRNGANSITCMSTNCTNVMDKATMSTILPYTLVHNWQAQVRNRRIDSSPYCRWCPNVACDKVAISRSETLKEQFGKVSTCSCQQCWCGGCQGDPHWPASCDQMAAYRKLLAKTNSMFTLPSDDIVLEVKVKKCPGCKYPIEKSNGCNAMLCSMCNYSFCWNCLEQCHTHSRCEQKNIETVTHLLISKLEIKGPLSWYPHCIMLQTNMKRLQNIKPWLQHLHAKATCPFLLSLPHYATNESAKLALLRAEECLLFLKQAYTLQESMQVLIGFAELSDSSDSKTCAKRARRELCRLDFITCRLSDIALEKSLSHLCTVVKSTTQLLHAGRRVMKELSRFAPTLQNMSKDIETTSIGKLNPALLIRHK